MGVLHDRLISAHFWADGEMHRWCGNKRLTYIGTWALAEASGCLLDDMTEWKVGLYPLDSRVTEKKLEQWRDEFIEDKKMIRYADRHLFIVHFHDWQVLRNAKRPRLPLPPWVDFQPFPTNKSQGQYVIDRDLLNQVVCSDKQLSLSLSNQSLNLSPGIELNRTEVELSEGSAESFQKPPREDSGALTAYWVKAMQAEGRVISSVDRNKFGRFAKEILVQGVRWPDALAAVDKMVSKNLGPHLLGSLVNEVQAKPGGTRIQDARIKWLRGLYQKYGDEARTEAKSDAEWQEAIGGGDA